MDLEPKQPRLTRWIDGELDGDELREFEQALADDPQLAAAKAEAENLRQLLQSEMPDRDIPNPEFFNSQIQRRIADESADTTRSPGPGSSPASNSGILSWFLSPFTLASAAAVIALGLFALSQLPGGNPSTDHTSVASTYTPDKAIDARDFYSAAADATVIVLDGLSALPDSTEIKGQNIVSAGPGSPGELYNEDRQLAFVILPGADSVPIIRSFQ
jgi:anti-sigma factor RsiW